jgi:zinc D-Ala-D-Ala carboxypeptidase
MFKRKKLLLIGASILLVLAAVLVLAGRANAPGGIFGKSEDKKTDQNQPPAFDKSKYSTSDPASIWVVVNKQRPLDPLAYVPSDLTSIDGQQMRAEAATALQKLIDAAKDEGYELKPLSGYRSYSYQKTVYNREVANYGQATADTQSAKPGHSEHQTGLAMDVGGGGCNIDDCFGNTNEGKWVAANAYKYGFVVRYIAGKESVTGYRAEPWHIRYVGIELATEMHNTGVATLEEFFGL